MFGRLIMIHTQKFIVYELIVALLGGVTKTAGYVSKKNLIGKFIR